MKSAKRICDCILEMVDFEFGDDPDFRTFIAEMADQFRKDAGTVRFYQDCAIADLDGAAQVVLGEWLSAAHLSVESDIRLMNAYER